jgi:hypothetical protein
LRPGFRRVHLEVALISAPACEHGRGFIVDGDTVIDQDTGKEPDPETLRKIRADEPTGPFDFVCVIVRPPDRGGDRQKNSGGREPSA